MYPKMTIHDAAKILGASEQDVYQQLKTTNLPFISYSGRALSNAYFSYLTSKHLFKYTIKPLALAFHIVKGGTGKTSLAYAMAIRSNLLGFKVLVIDLDQQGNLTDAFGIDANSVPVMIDILAEDYKFKDAITEVYPGLDIIASRIENALIDDIIKIKKNPLDLVYRKPIQELKKFYDLIIIDCPPNLGQSVASVNLGVDLVVSPVIPESFALSGLKTTVSTIKELEHDYQHKINFKVVINKYDPRTLLSQDAWQMLRSNNDYKDHLLHTYIRNSQDYCNSVAKGESIYDAIKPSMAKSDIDHLTLELLNLTPYKKPIIKSSNIEALVI